MMMDNFKQIDCNSIPKCHQQLETAVEDLTYMMYHYVISVMTWVISNAAVEDRARMEVSLSVVVQIQLEHFEVCVEFF